MTKLTLIKHGKRAEVFGALFGQIMDLFLI